MHLEAQLPPLQRATSLCELFLNHVSWLFRPINRDQVMDELMPKAYPKHSHVGGGSHHFVLDAHELAMLFIIFGSAAAVDVTLPPFNSEAQRYAELCRAALSLGSVFENPSLLTIQTVAVLAHFDVVSGKENSMESSWRMMCLAFSLSSSVRTLPLHLLVGGNSYHLADESP